MCLTDEECLRDGPERACLQITHIHRICAHKHLLPPDTADWCAIVMTFVLCAIAAGGGIGGGGLLLPLFILLLAFTPHDASPLTNVTVLGGAIANLAFYYNRQHPSGRKPLISYEVALMMESMTMVGALAGVLLNKIFPGWLITVLLVIVLGITTKRTLTKGLSLWRKESVALNRPDAVVSLLPQADKDRISEALAEGEQLPETPGRDRTGLMASPQLSNLMLAERRSPKHDIGLLVLALFLCTLLSVLRGPNYASSPLRLHCGSAGYWGIIALQAVVLLLISFYTRQVLLKRQQERVDAGYPFLPDDVQWTQSTSILYPLACAIAGLCAGLFGIGGGIVKGPLMLEMGMLPQVASATSAFMILFTSASAALQYAMLGDLRPTYAAALFVSGLCGTACGQILVGAAIRKYGRQSLIILIIAVIIGGSTLVMTVTGVMNLQNELHEGKSQGFRPLCESAMVDDR